MQTITAVACSEHLKAFATRSTSPDYTPLDGLFDRRFLKTNGPSSNNE